MQATMHCGSSDGRFADWCGGFCITKLYGNESFGQFIYTWFTENGSSDFLGGIW